MREIKIGSSHYCLISQDHPLHPLYAKGAIRNLVLQRLAKLRLSSAVDSGDWLTQLTSPITEHNTPEALTACDEVIKSLQDNPKLAQAFLNLSTRAIRFENPNEDPIVRLFAMAIGQNFSPGCAHDLNPTYDDLINYHPTKPNLSIFHYIFLALSFALMPALGKILLAFGLSKSTFIISLFTGFVAIYLIWHNLPYEHTLIINETPQASPVPAEAFQKATTCVDLTTAPCVIPTQNSEELPQKQIANDAITPTPQGQRTSSANTAQQVPAQSDVRRRQAAVTELHDEQLPEAAALTARTCF